jgi:uracil-DNA glycosylase
MVNLKEATGEWYPHLRPLFREPYFQEIGKTIASAVKQGYRVYPAAGDIFKAFKLCPPSKLRVVILGQDPYHNGAATGLAFANAPEKAISPSLRVIQKELAHSYGDGFVFNQDLEYWAQQGVLLLNTALTVVEGKPGSHLEIWKPFISDLIDVITVSHTGIVFMLWGAKAQAWETIEMSMFNHLLKAPHPAAELYGGSKSFVGSRNFLDADGLLLMNFNEVIYWDYEQYKANVLDKQVSEESAMPGVIGHRPPWSNNT